MKKILCFAVSIFLLFPALQNDVNEITEIIDEVDEDTLFNFIQTIQDFGEHITGSTQCEKVANFIYDTFEKSGLNVSYHNWSRSGYSGKNVVAILQGKTDSSVVVSAHYDSYPTSPGADDDGSGIACLLMAAEILRNYEFQHTIKFVAFSGEEQGMLGSKSYVRTMYERGEDILADINVDTVGHAVSKEGGEVVRVLTDEASIWITEIAEEICETYSSKINLGLYRHGNFPAGDHQSFLDYGYEAVFFVEYEFNPNIHNASDVIEHINKSYLTKVCKLITVMTAKIADAEFSVRIKFKEPEMGSIYINAKKIMSIDEHYSIILGRIHAFANIISDENIKRVEFYFDGEVDGFCSSPPYEHIYDSIAFFKHSIKVVAVTDNNRDMNKLNVVVFNLLPPGPPHN